MGKAKKSKKFWKPNLRWRRNEKGEYEYLDKKDERLANLMKQINKK